MINGDQARQWLIDNDPEAAEFWKDPTLTDEALINSLVDNLMDFGVEHQTGEVIVLYDAEPKSHLHIHSITVE